MTEGIRWDIPEIPDSYGKGGKTLDGELHSVLRKGSFDRKLILAQQLKDVWEKVAPEEVLDHTGSLFVEEGKSRRTLVVLLDSPLLAADLNSRGILLLVKVNKVVERKKGLRPFDAITFKVSRRSVINSGFKKDSQYKGSHLEKVTPIPLTKKEMDSVEETLLCVPEEKLRERIKAAMVASLEWQKGIDRSK